MGCGKRPTYLPGPVHEAETGEPSPLPPPPQPDGLDLLGAPIFSQAATQFSSEAHAQPGQAINYTLRQPLGVAACISPWNLPLYLLSWKIAPALAVGNTVVAKPSEITPATASRMAELATASGLPEGLIPPSTVGLIVN